MKQLQLQKSYMYFYIRFLISLSFIIIVIIVGQQHNKCMHVYIELRYIPGPVDSASQDYINQQNRYMFPRQPLFRFEIKLLSQQKQYALISIRIFYYSGFRLQFNYVNVVMKNIPAVGPSFCYSLQSSFMSQWNTNKYTNKQIQVMSSMSDYQMSELFRYKRLYKVGCQYLYSILFIFCVINKLLLICVCDICVCFA
eukprot:TRINITY_DN1210_c0_g1_i5.p1 TRINITY_DN1210_c0_g1~~TRINITY_DN1210_c0_g1_i5.p1  ORF type:complete len:197 (+),score=-20.28 TRINITY_DN1210_c0_g1_i5:235-825(+)